MRVMVMVLVCAVSAQAGPLEVFGYGGVGLARGGAETAGADDFSATFYNPGRVVGAKSVGLGIGYNYSVPVLYAENDTGPIKELKRPPDMGGMHLGFIFPLGGKIEDKVAIGLALFLPTVNIVRTQSVDEKTPQFYMFTSNTDKLAVMTAIGVQILPELSAGAGVSNLSSLGGGVDFAVDVFNKRFEKRNLSIDLLSAIAPLAGISWAPTKELRFGAAYKGELDLRYSLPTVIDLGRDVGALALDIGGVAHWTPHTFTLGAWTLVAEKLILEGEIGYQLWSRAPRDQVQVKLDLSGEVIDGLGLGQALDLDTSQDPEMRFFDIWVPRIGVEWKAADWLAVRGGYFYRPSPVPDQVQRTNYLDNNTHGISAGAGMSFNDPLEVFAAPVHFDLWMQTSVLAQRAAIKLKNLNDPIGSYKFGGTVWHFGAALRYTLK